MKATIFLFVLVFSFLKMQAQTVTDYDGNVYHTLVIGSQVWLGENLRVTHYNNGDPITNVTGMAEWGNLITGARCYYNNDSASYDSVYGPLYNWYAVNDQRGICPSGWYVPSDADWTNVETFLGGYLVAGGKMKETGTLHWLPPNTGATNTTGFTGLPGGARGIGNNFQFIRENGIWWTTTSYNSSNAWSRYMWYMYAGVDANPTPKFLGLSIRCMREIGVGGDDRLEEKFKLYPNPAKEKIRLECPGGKQVSVLIFNHSGQLILQKDWTGNTGEMDISTLNSGIYFLQVSTHDRTELHRFIKK